MLMLFRVFSKLSLKIALTAPLSILKYHIQVVYHFQKSQYSLIDIQYECVPVIPTSRWISLSHLVISKFAAFGAIVDLLVESGLVILDKQRLGQRRTNDGSTGAPQALCI